MHFCRAVVQFRADSFSAALAQTVMAAHARSNSSPAACGVARNATPLAPDALQPESSPPAADRDRCEEDDRGSSCGIRFERTPSPISDQRLPLPLQNLGTQGPPMPLQWRQWMPFTFPRPVPSNDIEAKLPLVSLHPTPGDALDPGAAAAKSKTQLEDASAQVFQSDRSEDAAAEAPPGTHATHAPDQVVKLFVGRLPAETNVHDLRTAFSVFGLVKSVKLIGVRQDHGARCAFVRILTLPSALNAIHECHERLIFHGVHRFKVQVALARGEAQRLGVPLKHESFPATPHERITTKRLKSE